MDKGSAEEEKIDAILNSSVSSLCLPRSQETVLLVPPSIYPQGLMGSEFADRHGYKDLLWA